MCHVHQEASRIYVCSKLDRFSVTKFIEVREWAHTSTAVAVRFPFDLVTLSVLPKITLVTVLFVKRWKFFFLLLGFQYAVRAVHLVILTWSTLDGVNLAPAVEPSFASRTVGTPASAAPWKMLAETGYFSSISDMI